LESQVPVLDLLAKTSKEMNLSKALPLGLELAGSTQWVFHHSLMCLHLEASTINHTLLGKQVPLGVALDGLAGSRLEREVSSLGLMGSFIIESCLDRALPASLSLDAAIWGWALVQPLPSIDVAGRAGLEASLEEEIPLGLIHDGRGGAVAAANCQLQMELDAYLSNQHGWELERKVRLNLKTEASLSYEKLMALARDLMGVSVSASMLTGKMMSLKADLSVFRLNGHLHESWQGQMSLEENLFRSLMLDTEMNIDNQAPYSLDSILLSLVAEGTFRHTYSDDGLVLTYKRYIEWQSWY
jgi:hypothetical protein